MHKLQQHIIKNWSAHLHDLFLFEVGLSGGVDSVVLLHILNSILPLKNFKLRAIHINHGISANALQWELFCQELCTKMGVELNIFQHKVTKVGGESLENNARLIRYNHFLNSEAQVIALAHHRNDQIETVLSQIFRGSDVHNIASMESLSIKQNKPIWRPLLDIPRNEIENYAREFSLPYITDESNFDTSYLRNFIRHQILPLLLEFDSDVEGKILKLPHQLQNILSIIDEVASNDLLALQDNQIDNLNPKMSKNPSINLVKFRNLSTKRQQQLINCYIKQQHLPLPSGKQINEFIRQALNSKWDSTPSLILNKNHSLIKTKNLITIEESIP
jgi:tRNA(Ile)-lysidine synthase